MNDNTPSTAGQPPLPPIADVETEYLTAIEAYFDSPGDTTRRPSRGPIGLQTRPDEFPPAPPTDKDKQS